MIRYSLRCEKDHSFESWFQSSSAYDAQVRRKLVACPGLTRLSTPYTPTSTATPATISTMPKISRGAIGCLNE